MRGIPGLLVLALAVACGERPAPPAPAPVDFGALARDLQAWTPEHGPEPLLAAEALLVEAPEDLAARADFVRCLERCAAGILALESGDPYPQLARARAALADARLDGSLCEERRRLAQGFFDLGNLHAARELATSGGCPPAQAEWLEWLEGPLAVLAAGRPALFADEPADPLLDRLLDLFALPARNGWYDLSELSLNEDWTPAGTRDRRPAGALLRAVLGDAPPAEDATEEVPDEHVGLTGLALDPGTRAELARASAAVRAGARPQDLTALTRLFELVLEGSALIEHRSLESGLALTLGGGERNGVLVIVERGEESPVWWRAAYPLYAMRLIDLDADGRQELVLSAREGSGGFLTVECLAVDPLRALFAEAHLHKGGLVPVQLDPDPPLELLLSWGTDEQTVPCNQCPRTFATLAFDFDPEQRIYRPVADRKGSSERLLRAHGNVAGMGPHMFLEVLRDEHDLPAYLHELERAEELSEERVLEVLRVVFEFGEHYRSLKAYDEALALLAGFCDAVGRPDAPGEIPLMRAAAHVFAGQLAYESLQFQAGIDLMDEPWFVERAAADESVRRDRLVLRANLCQLAGRLDEEFEHYSEVLAMEPEPRRDVLGNLASYYNLVGEHDQARAVAGRALDLALAAGDLHGMMLDMLHLASAAFHGGDHLASLEWIERALPIARAMPTGGYDSALLRIAADVALVQGRPDVALELLDESLMVVDEAMWASGGGAVLLLAGTAFERSGETDLALRAYRTASRLAAPVDSQVHATAALRASMLLETVLGDEEEALRWAEEAFAAAVTGRERIGVEGHQFSFLSDKEHIVEWLSRLLWRQEERRGRIAEVIGAWKLQVFRDTYRKRGAGSEEEADQVPRPPSGTLLLDYFLGERCAFVVRHLADRAPEVIALSCSGPEVATLVRSVHRAFDLRDPSSLRAIRSNSVSEELAHDLARLHELLLEPAAIPATIERIVLAPDDELFGVPWAAVRDGSGRMLVDGPRVTLVPSLRLLTTETAPPPAARRACVVGAFGALRNAELPPWARSAAQAEETVVLPRLRYGPEECEAIGEALRAASFEVDTLLDPAGEPLRGSTSLGRPTAAALLASLPGHQLVHVTAHGLFHAGSPMDSCLFVADRQALRARDLAALDLSDVELISLAACQSGRNAARVGAEPMGFLRALLGAGARRVLVAEWEVDDRRTKELMSRTYRRAATLPLAQALQAAQREVRDDFEHPYYWAGLTLYERTLE